MKKQIFFAAATVLAFAFTSCKKYEVSAPLDLSGLSKVQVSGTLLAELDESNAGLETIPAGVKVTATIDLDQYNPNNNSNDKHVVSATTDANGRFSINIPVTTAGVDVQLSFESFTYEKVFVDYGTEKLSEVTQYKLDNVSLNDLGVDASETSIDLSDLVYYEDDTDPNAGTFTPTTSITYSGVLTYEVERRAGVLQPDTIITAPIPAGTVLFVDIYSEDMFGREFYQSKSVTVTAGGNYSIEVPLVKNGYAEIQFGGMEILQFDDVVAVPVQKGLYEYNLYVNETLQFVDYTNQDHVYTQGTFIKEVN